MPARESIKINGYALQEGEGGTIILRGVIDPDSLHLLKTPAYQREVLTGSKINKLMVALQSERGVPDVELGMRGTATRDHGEAIYLQDDVFIIDGLQRVTAGIQLMRTAGARPTIGAVVHFDTNEAWERERFKILNVDRTKVSSSVLLRNLKDTNEAIGLLHKLTEDRTFAMGGRVCWQQNMNREHLISARTFVGTLGRLHSHAGPGLSVQYEHMAVGLQKTMTGIGPAAMRENARTFFAAIDSVWGLQRIAFRERVVHVRENFLWSLATVFSDHLDFWKNERLAIDRDLVSKLGSFPVTDPEVARLAGAGSTALEVLYHMLVKHIDSGKRTRRLTPRAGQGIMERPTQSPSA